MPSQHAQNFPDYQQNIGTALSASANQNSPLVPPPAGIATSTEQKQPVIGRRAVVLGGATIAATAVIGSGALLAPKFLSRSTTPISATKIIPGPQKLIPGIPLLALTGHSDAVRSVIWAPDGKYLATGGADTRVMLWDIEGALQKKPNAFQTISTPMKAWKFTNEILENRMGWSYDGRMLGVADLVTKTPHLLDAFGKSNKPQDYMEINACFTNPYSLASYDYLAMSPVDNTFATSVLSENKLVLWQQNKTTAPIESLDYTQTLANIPAGIEHLHWSSDGAFIAGTPANFSIVVWQVKTGKVVQKISMPERSKKQAVLLERGDLKYSPIDPHRLAATDIDIVTVYDTQHNKLLFSLGTDDKDALTLPQNNTVGWIPQVGGTSWSPNGRYIAGTYGRSNKIYIWDMQEKNPHKAQDGTQIQSLLFGAHNGHNLTVIDIAWSPDGRYIATASFDKTVIIWKVDGA